MLLVVVIVQVGIQADFFFGKEFETAKIHLETVVAVNDNNISLCARGCMCTHGMVWSCPSWFFVTLSIIYLFNKKKKRQLYVLNKTTVKMCFPSIACKTVAF